MRFDWLKPVEHFPVNSRGYPMQHLEKPTYKDQIFFFFFSQHGTKFGSNFATEITPTILLFADFQ